MLRSFARRIPSPPHHTSRGFCNPGIKDTRSARDFLRWRRERRSKEVPPPESYRFPRRKASSIGVDTLTWVGQSTLLLRIGKTTLLTDPHFSDRASPFSWAGPRRTVPPSPSLAELPPIDLVLISHDHYDHLDAATVDRLADDGGGGSMRFVVPLGLKRWFTSRGIGQVTELDWWEGTSFEGVRVTAVPVQHWSKRKLFEGFRTLWAGYVVEVSGIIFLFVGDTGYSPLLGESARRLGPIDLAALPIGAYAPRWFMKPYHMTPEEAVQVHLDLGGPPTVALHWGTFALADEPLDEPPRRLRQELSRRGIGEERFRVLEHGQSLPLEVLLDRGTPSD